jgi:hypothetical protein
VLDEVNGQWSSVTVRPGKCENIDTEVWGVLTLHATPDGSLSGDYVEGTPSECFAKHTVTVTRTGDVESNVQVADPDTQAVRLVSKAQGLHGRYHWKSTYSGGKFEDDFTFQTDCLRTGDRCISFLTFGEKGQGAMVFANGTFVRKVESNGECPAGGTSHDTITGIYPLPVTPEDPIALLTGRTTQEISGSSCVGNVFDDTFTRTGD